MLGFFGEMGPYSRLALLLLFCFSSVCALSPEDAQLLQKEYQQYQAWVLGRNYFFGTTLKSDPVKALAWQIIYVEMLPQSYPGKEQLLLPYERDLTTSQIAEAKLLARTLRDNYELLAPFNERELSRVAMLHEMNVSWSELQITIPTPEIQADFNRWLTWLEANSYSETALNLEQAKQELTLNKAYPIVYGQIIIKGPESLARVRSPVRIFPGGFFIGQATDKVLSFFLPGYNSVTIEVNMKQRLQSISPIIFAMPVANKKTGLIGRVLPWSGIENSNMLLRRVNSEIGEQRDPWYQPALPLTIINNGQFYTTGLSPGRYELFINTAGLSTSKVFALGNGEIRGLSLIDLRKQLLKKM